MKPLLVITTLSYSQPEEAEKTNELQQIGTICMPTTNIEGYISTFYITKRFFYGWWAILNYFYAEI